MACNLTTGEVEYIDKTIADLKTENDQLVMKLNAEHLVRQNLAAESAELRELVRDMAAEMRGLGVDFKRVGWCDYADRMRELGVDE